LAGLDKSIDTIVNVSGGAECFAALWWAKERGLNAVGLHLYNNPNNELARAAQLHYAKKQCEFFNFPLVVDTNELPQEIALGLAVNQHMSAATTLLLGNPRKWKYLVWGANAEDSFAQRLQLRFPIRAYFAQRSYQLDMHGVAAQEVINAPINIFPFETLYKSEILSMLAKNLWDFAKENIWYCYPSSKDIENGNNIKHNPDGSYTPCGSCGKCIEWKHAVNVANSSVYKQQEGTFKRKKPKQQWIDE
tara:strand:+ start:779 stop:1522 length:744 start_codon:yes stop_codon:yes gene_type:complete